MSAYLQAIVEMREFISKYKSLRTDTLTLEEILVIDDMEDHLQAMFEDEMTAMDEYYLSEYGENYGGTE